jgi:hypothetical protein
MEIAVTVVESASKTTAEMLRFLKLHGPEATVSQADPDAPQVLLQLRAAFKFGQLTQAAQEPRRAGEKLRKEVAFEGMAFLKTAQFALFSDSGEELLTWVVRRRPQPEHEAIHEVRYDAVLPLDYFTWAGGRDVMDVKVREGEDVVVVRAVGPGMLPLGLEAVLKGRGPKKTLAKDAKKSSSARKRQKKQRIGTMPFPPVIERALQQLQYVLAEMQYLGPLRSPPRRYYVATGAGLEAADEFLPFVLRDRGDEAVWYCPPQQLVPEEQGLTVALDNWLSYLRTGEARTAPSEEEVSVATTKGVLAEVALRSVSGVESHALADSGFGYSQVLPILVRGLLTDRGNTIVVEQPELHLNPGLQVKLAEFLVGLVSAGKQVVVETHSEHIVNAVRTMTAEAEREVPQATVFFLDIVEGRPEIRELSIREDGTVDGWPQTFFGEAANLAGRLLRAQRRFAERGPE